MKCRIVILSCALISLSASIAAGQSTWAERLAFPAEAKVLILHGSDMGLAYEFNRPVEESLQSGMLTSASVVSAGPWFAQCGQWAKDMTDLDLGISLSFISPSRQFQWGPISSRDAVPSLTTSDGYFTASRLQFSMRADLDQVRQEAEAQIQRARAAGLEPTHLHPHLGALLTRPDLLQLYLDLAEELWIPAVMVEFTPDLVDRLVAQGLTVDVEVMEVVGRYRLPKIDDIRHLPPTGSYEEKREALLSLIQELPPGITQVSLHPADETPGLQCLTDKWQNRVWEAQLLDDPAVRDALHQEGILLTNWRDIMKRFEAVGEGRPVEDE
jgi:hypothetical protein